MFGRFLEASHLNGVHQTEDLDHFVGGDRSRVVLVIHPECPPICIKIKTVQIIRRIRQKSESSTFDLSFSSALLELHMSVAMMNSW